MGFFSWKTQDTNRSIANQYSIRPTFHVEMVDDKGNAYIEDDYEGYGYFGGKSFYSLLAEMNGINGTEEEKASLGIRLAFDNNPSGDKKHSIKYPNLVEESNGWKYNSSGPESCEYQGYFYEDE